MFAHFILDKTTPIGSEITCEGQIFISDSGCRSSMIFGTHCNQINTNCMGDVVHPTAGFCPLGCKSGYGPFCIENPPSTNTLQGVCPMCSHCKNSVCDGTGPGAYFDCPRNWVGMRCKGKFLTVFLAIC